MSTSSGYRILGVDPGTRAAGYGIIECRDGGGRSPFEYLECGVLRPTADDSVQDRIAVIAGHLQELIAEFRPSVLALEKAFHGKNAASALKLGQARGAIMLLASQLDLPTYEYAPAQIKQSVVGNGRASKEQIQNRVRLLFRLKRVPASDAADALAIALCHGHAAPRADLRVLPPKRARGEK